MSERFGLVHVVSAAVMAAALWGVAACSVAPSDQMMWQEGDKPITSGERVAEQRRILPPGQPATSQETFASPDEAVRALVMAAESKDHADVKKIFGPAAGDLVSGDPVEDENDFNAFADATTQSATLEERTPSEAILHIGKNDWAFPIPIAKTHDGKWYFDTVAGETEILARRIGANELDAIDLCREYVDAQREYASQDRDGDEVLEYAQRLLSSNGQHDGLYWPAGGGPQAAGASPFGEVAAEAEAQGYGPVSGSHKTPTAYHGYYFHVLKAQGPAAPGGAYSYVINGNMIAGFALVAYPAEYGKSGIMTFIVSHQGKVFQKDLGAKTAEVAGRMTTYNPDRTWTAEKQ